MKLAKPDDVLQEKMNNYNADVDADKIIFNSESQNAPKKINPACFKGILTQTEDDEDAQDCWLYATPREFLNTEQEEDWAREHLLIEDIADFDPKHFGEAAKVAANRILQMTFANAAKKVDNSYTESDFEDVWNEISEAAKETFLEIIMEKYRDSDISKY